MIPRKFRITDFRSIIDSGECPLSADNITVLAGQNEAGKTAILCALRDFDLGVGVATITPEFIPEGKYEAAPAVSVEFEVNIRKIAGALQEDMFAVPRGVLERLEEKKLVWVKRDLLKNKYVLDDDIEQLWRQTIRVDAHDDTPDDENENSKKLLEIDEFTDFLRNLWPTFVYFDSFDDTLPREVPFDMLYSYVLALRRNPMSKSEIPQSVLDFISLSNVNLEKVSQLADQDKALGNYLNNCGTQITGDFLTYWTQRGNTKSVDLLVKHVRDQQGQLKLQFYVHDSVDQYPEQRSKGFLWFLSFYLRLAAAHKREPDRERLLLIDEPGSYLHAKAQRDVLRLFEDRIAPQQQIIYSTHSQTLLPANQLHRMRVVLKNGEKGTQILDRLTHPLLQGGEFKDTLSPIISAIGFDIQQMLTFVREKNFLVEGISDHMYLSTWSRRFHPYFNDQVNIFPGTGASTLPTLASLFIGWGLPFAILLDRDKAGEEAKDRFTNKLAVSESLIIQPKDAVCIEDFFSFEDFRNLLSVYDNTLTLNSGEKPSNAIKRLKLDKVLLARTYAEHANDEQMSLTHKTKNAIDRLFRDVVVALELTAPAQS